MEEWGVFTWEERPGQWWYLRGQTSLSLSPETVKLGLGAKLSGGVITHTVERWTSFIWPPTPWPWGLWWQTVLRVMLAPACLVTSLQCLRGDPVLIIIPSDQTPHNERAGPAGHQSMTDNYIFILSSSHHQQRHISWSPCDLSSVQSLDFINPIINL